MTLYFWGLAVFCHATSQKIMPLHQKSIVPHSQKILPQLSKFFIAIRLKVFSAPSTATVCLLFNQHLGWTFLPLNIYACLPNESSVCRFTLPDIYVILYFSTGLKLNCLIDTVVCVIFQNYSLLRVLHSALNVYLEISIRGTQVFQSL